LAGKKFKCYTDSNEFEGDGFDGVLYCVLSGRLNDLPDGSVRSEFVVSVVENVPAC